MTKTVCKTNIKKALRKSWDTGEYEYVTDEWVARFDRNPKWLGISAMTEMRVTLWNMETGDEIAFGVGGCTSMTEYVDYAAECTMRRFTERLAA